MESNLTFHAEDLARLDAMGDDVLSGLAELTQEPAALRGLDVCEVVHRVLPILETIKSVVCALKFIPGLKQACTALETVINLLRSVCP